MSAAEHTYVGATRDGHVVVVRLDAVRAVEPIRQRGATSVTEVGSLIYLDHGNVIHVDDDSDTIAERMREAFMLRADVERDDEPEITYRLSPPWSKDPS